MAITFQSIRWGWVAIAGIVLTGTTIYVTNNQRHQVEQKDVIELALGVHERCLATLFNTNPVQYEIAPITNYTSLWVEETTNTTATVTNVINGVTNISTVTNWACITNVYTNAIGMHVNRQLMAVIDAQIRALIPLYVNTNTLYDGSSNIEMLTITGLFHELNIGNGTNFTRTPSWTNTYTGYVVSYTQDNFILYEAGLVYTNIYTNGGIVYYYGHYTTYYTNLINDSAITNHYTSSVPLTANYSYDHYRATNVTITSGSNIINRYRTQIEKDYYAFRYTNQAFTNGQEFVVTNSAIYDIAGDGPPWQIYEQDLVERYKVLNALTVTKTRQNGPLVKGFAKTLSYGSYIPSTWALALQYVTMTWPSVSVNQVRGQYLYDETIFGNKEWSYPGGDGFVKNYYHAVRQKNYTGKLTNYFNYVSSVAVTQLYSVSPLSTDVYHSLEFWYSQSMSNYLYTANTQQTIQITQYDRNGFPEKTFGWHPLFTFAYDVKPSGYTTNVSYGYTDTNTVPTACDEPTETSSYYSDLSYTNWHEIRGGPYINGGKEIVRWQFNYCTNRFW